MITLVHNIFNTFVELFYTLYDKYNGKRKFKNENLV